MSVATRAPALLSGRQEATNTTVDTIVSQKSVVYNIYFAYYPPIIQFLHKLQLPPFDIQKFATIIKKS